MYLGILAILTLHYLFTHITFANLTLMLLQAMLLEFSLHFEILMTNITTVITFLLMCVHVLVKVGASLARETTQLAHVVPVVRVSDHVRLQLTSEDEALLTDTAEEFTHILEVHT